DPHVRDRDATASRGVDRARAVFRDEVRRVDDDPMALAEQRVDEGGGGSEDRTVLLVRVGGRDEEPTTKLVARHVGGAEAAAEKSRAMRLPHPRKAHDEDE